MQCKVSVIIPTYNRARDLERCLDSLVAQTFKDFEVLVCDDGSTDDTSGVAQRYQGALNLSYHLEDNFGGPARPRNLGLQMAKGDYVAFLDSDDWWCPDKLNESVKALDAGCDVVYHPLYIVHSQKGRRHFRRTRNKQLQSPVYNDLLLCGNDLPHSSVVTKRHLMISIGGFSEDRDLIAWEDYDAWLRLAQITERFCFLDKTLGYYWAGGGNITNPLRTISNLKSFRERYLLAEGFGDKEPAWFCYALARAYQRVGLGAKARNHLYLAFRKANMRMRIKLVIIFLLSFILMNKKT